MKKRAQIQRNLKIFWKSNRKGKENFPGNIQGNSFIDTNFNGFPLKEPKDLIK